MLPLLILTYKTKRDFREINSHANMNTSKATIPCSLLELLEGPQKGTSNFLGPRGGKTRAEGGTEKVKAGGLWVAISLAMIRGAV